MSDEKTEDILLKHVPIEWYIPDTLVSGYATNMTLQRTEHEFVLSFYEQRLPIIVGGNHEENIAQARQIESVRATCFARVTIAAARFPGFMDVLQNALKNLAEEES